MAKAEQHEKSESTGWVLLYLRAGEDVSIIRNLLAGMAAEGVVCADLQDLCRRMVREDVDAILLTESALADGALPILAEVLHRQPHWSDLPVLFVTGGGLESPLAVQAMRELPNVLILDRPVRIATLTSALQMALRIRNKQRQVRDLMDERQRREQVLRERMKELACLYAVSRDMQKDPSLDELCRRAVGHLVSAMRFPELAVAVIELNDRRFTSGNHAEGLSHGFQAEIRVEGEVLGHLRVYYAQERPFLIPEEQNLLNGVAETFSTWLERQRAEEAAAGERGAVASLSRKQRRDRLAEGRGWTARFPESELRKALQRALEDWKGKTDFELWLREVAEEFRRNDLAMLASGGPKEVMERAATPDGSETWWLNNKFVFRSSSGRRYVGGLGVDITERRAGGRGVARERATG